MALTTLPNELLLAITSNLTDQSDLNALVQTSRRLYETLDEELYRLNVEDGNSSALLWASLHGHEASVRKLLRLKADVNACTSMRETTLPAAISVENASIVTRNLQQEITKGRARLIASPLLYAAAMNHTAIMRLLIDAGAEVHRRHGCHRIPIMAAADQGRVDALEMLLDAGADIEAHGTNCNTPVSLAASKGHLAAVKALLARGATVDTARRGRTALMRAAQIGHYDTVRALLDAGADVAPHDHSERTALMAAAQSGDYDTVCALLDAGADPSEKDYTHRTAATLAMDGDHDNIALVLLEDGGANPNAPSDNGTTALFAAVHQGNASTVNTLLQHGADPNQPRTPRGTTPLTQALHAADTPIVRALLDSGATSRPANLRTALRGAALSWDSTEGETFEIARLLIEHGADPMRDLYDGGRRLLLAVAAKGDTEFLSALLARWPLDVNCSARNGRTPLFFAVQQGNLEMARLLLARGADPNRVKDGRSLVRWAEERDGADGASLVQLLVEHGGRCDGLGRLDPVELMIEAQESILSGMAEMGL
ncbi:ankyrin [Aspergillus campestris IBT 28561]|uniref:Ankyrin n=1 Tax=Aspergillus campestris (strain IBT 28561) TaxID=1392248 RepID=A0A2I1CWH8_ASPC2|nr:ankyrin [Aspergillus campestris IBT 28561]PKY01978.1 ankyrin [Aspergillus campestris IBT 28561]